MAKRAAADERQIPLPFDPLVQPEVPKDATIRQRFEAFHKANPHVYGHLVRLALDIRQRGHDKWGIANLFEVLRWESALYTTGDPYRLNNNFRAWYARILMADNSELEGFFEVRKLHARGSEDVQ